jgi:hypothetical protein
LLFLRKQRTEGEKRPRVRRKSRFAVQAGVVVLASVLVPLGTSSAAHADDSCPTGINYVVSNFDPTGTGSNTYVAVGEQTIATTVTPDFFVSESHVVDNGTNQTITGSFTSTVAKTFSYTVGGSVGGSFFGFVTASVNGSITMSTTTTTGVTATAPIPPGGQAIGEYGVEGYDITVQDNEWEAFGGPELLTSPPTGCWEDSTASYSIKAPTSYTGWKVIYG